LAIAKAWQLERSGEDSSPAALDSFINFVNILWMIKRHQSLMLCGQGSSAYPFMPLGV